MHSRATALNVPGLIHMNTRPSPTTVPYNFIKKKCDISIYTTTYYLAFENVKQRRLNKIAQLDRWVIKVRNTYVYNVDMIAFTHCRSCVSGCSIVIAQDLWLRCLRILVTAHHRFYILVRIMWDCVWIGMQDEPAQAWRPSYVHDALMYAYGIT